jgi:hypothetical protein
MPVAQKDRARVGQYLPPLNRWLGGEPVRIQQIEPTQDGHRYELDGAARERIDAKLAEMAGGQIAGGPLKLAREVRGALEFFGITIPTVNPGAVDADTHLVNRPRRRE